MTQLDQIKKLQKMLRDQMRGNFPSVKKARSAARAAKAAKKAMLVIFMTACAVSARASSPLAGRLDLDSLPSLGAWQSLTSTDQAFGLSKRLFHLDYAGQPLVNVSIFAGASKPALTEPATPVRFLAGDVIQVPGSTLDWALGTKWGDAWLPKLKTGVLFAHDLSRLAAAHFAPDFIGVGASYPLWN